MHDVDVRSARLLAETVLWVMSHGQQPSHVATHVRYIHSLINDILLPHSTARCTIMMFVHTVCRCCQCICLEIYPLNGANTTLEL